MRAEYTNDLVVADGAWVDPRAYGATYDKTTLDAAIAAIGSDDKTLVIPAEAWSVADDLTIPANIHLKIMNGG